VLSEHTTGETRANKTGQRMVSRSRLRFPRGIVPPVLPCIRTQDGRAEVGVDVEQAGTLRALGPHSVGSTKVGDSSSSGDPRTRENGDAWQLHDFRLRLVAT